RDVVAAADELVRDEADDELRAAVGSGRHTFERWSELCDAHPVPLLRAPSYLPATFRPMDERRRVPAPRDVAASVGNPGAHLGPIPITATGVLIVIALIASIAYLAYAISVRDASQIPLLASGAVVLGIVFAAI